MLYFKVNENKRVYIVYTSDSVTQYRAFPLTKELNPDDKNVMGALYLNDKLIFDEEWEKSHKKPEPLFPSYTQNDVMMAIQQKLDNTAKMYDFDTMLSAVSYTNSNVPKFKAHAIALSQWRDDVWSWAYKFNEDINSGKITPPKILEEVIALIPEFVPPAS